MRWSVSRSRGCMEPEGVGLVSRPRGAWHTRTPPSKAQKPCERIVSLAQRIDPPYDVVGPRQAPQLVPVRLLMKEASSTCGSTNA